MYEKMAINLIGFSFSYYLQTILQRSHFHMVYTIVIPCAAKLASNNSDTLRVMPGSLQYAGRRVGRVSAVQCVGGMTLGEEAAVVRECGLLKESLGFSEGNLAMLKSDQMR